jgi:uncharacterized protein YjbI with pentapeptide repeats
MHPDSMAVVPEIPQSLSTVHSFAQGQDLSGANLSEVNLFRARLDGANLTRADLTRADLRNANLIEANLIEAKLSEADFSRADPKGTSSKSKLEAAAKAAAELRATYAHKRTVKVIEPPAVTRAKLIFDPQFTTVVRRPPH